jgi:hypothetical protein
MTIPTTERTRAVRTKTPPKVLQLRDAPFAVRVVRRAGGDAAIVYRRGLSDQRHERLVRIGALGPLAYTAAGALLRAALREVGGSRPGRLKLQAGPFHALDADWGARVACYAFVAVGLRDAERLQRAADHLRNADGAEAAWWLGLMARPSGERAVRALRILTEAVL